VPSKILLKPPMDLPIQPLDRIRRILRNSALGDVLQSDIAEEISAAAPAAEAASTA